MANKRNRYKQMELYMTGALVIDALLFLIYLIGAGNGVVWLKAVSAILIIGLSALCLVFLYISRELLRQRSLWMSTAAAALLLCTIFSLLLNYPSPNPYKNAEFDELEEQTSIIIQTDRI